MTVLSHATLQPTQTKQHDSHPFNLVLFNHQTILAETLSPTFVGMPFHDVASILYTRFAVSVVCGAEASLQTTYLLTIIQTVAKSLLFL